MWMALIAVLWTGFALRVAGIDWQSIWYDEGLSIYYARGTLAEVLVNASQSDHPPLHALLLQMWISLCGDSELSVRLMSAWWCTLSVALLYRLAKKLSTTAAVLSALLLALSPFAVWYSQETRGYTLALALIVALMDVAANLFPTPGASRPAANKPAALAYVPYTALAAAALYTHFYTGFVLIALNLAYLAEEVRRGWRLHQAQARARFWGWTAAQCAVLVLFAPWLPFVAKQVQMNATYWHGAVGWRQIVRLTAVAFSVGKTLQGPWAIGATWAFALLSAVGSYALYRRRHTRRWAWLLWLWIIVPTLFQIWINRSRPKFAPRYVFYSLPAFLLLASMGARWLSQLTARYGLKLAGWAAIVGLLATTAAIGGATARSLGNLYRNQSLYRPDFRAVAGYIEANALPGDLIVVVSGYSYPALAYYYRGPLRVLPLPDQLLPTTQQPIDLGTLETLNQAMTGHTRLWLVLWQPEVSDPTSLVSDELQHTYERLGVGRTFHDVALLLFDISPGPLLADSVRPKEPLSANFGPVQLTGYDLSTRTLKPGDTAYLYLYWRTLSKVGHDYKVFAQILDGSGHIIAQHDKIAGAAAYPTSHWPPEAQVRDRFMLTLTPDAKPGAHELIVGLYRPGQDMPRLPVAGEDARGDHVLLGQITVLSE